MALHGIRTAEAKLGDVVAVIGLGLLGQLTVQVLKAAGCRVLGMDIVSERAELASRMGADAVGTSDSGFRDLCLQHSAGHGADAVLITAETPSSGPVNLAAGIARDRAIVVAVGTVGMEIERKSLLRERTRFPHCAFLWSRPLRCRLRAERAATIPSATCAGRKLATWKPSATSGGRQARSEAPDHSSLSD